jgi:hypothetical protein
VWQFLLMHSQFRIQRGVIKMQGACVTLIRVSSPAALQIAPREVV